MPIFLLGFLGSARRALSAVGGWLSHRSIAELACIALAVFALVQHFSIAAERRHSVKVEAHDAQTGKLLKAERAAHADALAALSRQNQQVNALANKSAEQQAAAVKAEKRAAQRASEAEGVSARLLASSRHSGPAGGPCAPSTALKEQWQ